MALLSDLHLLSDVERILYLDAQVVDRALQLGVPEQQLNSPKILGLAINQRRLGPPHRVRSIGVSVKANLLDPAVHDAGALPSSKVRRCLHSTREDVVVASQSGDLDPGADGFARSSGDLELHRVASLVLDNDRPTGNRVAMANIADA